MEDFLFIDCQTTGFSPSSGSLLEIAWAWSGSDEIHSRVVALPPGEFLPPRVAEVTGIGPEELATAIPVDQARADFNASLSTRASKPVAVIHYAQFEKAFLKEFLHLDETDFPFTVLCSYQIAQRLFPNLPSRNIRGLAGYFGERLPEIKRASTHVAATMQIWRGLVAELKNRGIAIADLPEWLKTTAKPKNTRYEYRIDKEQRLNLPEQPGVYRMLSKAGEVLYVGKATNLRDRVNSYFRGRKGRDPRKLEMLAQAWSLKVTPVDSVLESALLENEEIKKYDPPYNVVFKARGRQMLFYSDDFEHRSATQNGHEPRGPFRFFNNVEQIRWLQQSLLSGEFRQVFYDDVPLEDLPKGFAVFVARRGQPVGHWTVLRNCVAWGLWNLRRQSREASVDIDEEADLEAAEEPVIERALTAEEIADKFERLFTRAGAEDHRARSMTRLLNARVRWKTSERWHQLDFVQGRTGAESVAAPADVRYPWRDLGIADYDRMAILLSELARYEHSVQPLQTKVGSECLSFA